MPFFILLLGTLSTFAAAQYSEQPLKESTSDLRSQTVLFSIEIPDDKKTYVLERTASEDFFLRLRIGQFFGLSLLHLFCVYNCHTTKNDN